MIDAELRAALESRTCAELLPDRSQARAGDLPVHAQFVDALVLESGNGGPAVIALMQAADRLLVVPARQVDGVWRRDPDVAQQLSTGDFGRFSVLVLDRGLPGGPPRVLEVDQSNDSVILGDSVIVKWQLEAVPSPAPARLRALMGLGITPDLRATVTWTDDNGIEHAVMTAADYLPGAQDGWTWAVDLVRAHAQGVKVDAFGPFSDIGEQIARMHLAFAESGVGQWGADDVAALLRECTSHADEAIRLIDGPEGERLRAREAPLRARLDALRHIDRTPVIDIHGDLHIGQMLKTTDGVGARYAVVDFDGNPVVSAAQRLSQQPAARDVAGMLASIDHVARVVNYRTEGLDSRPATIWIAHAQEAFLGAYQATLEQAGQRALLDDRLISPLMIDQECREYIYSARHLPHWRYVPDAVICGLFPEES